MAPKPADVAQTPRWTSSVEENKRLRRELRCAELEREILKKATAYFAKESQ